MIHHRYNYYRIITSLRIIRFCQREKSHAIHCSNRLSDRNTHYLTLISGREQSQAIHCIPFLEEIEPSYSLHQYARGGRAKLPTALTLRCRREQSQANHCPKRGRPQSEAMNCTLLDITAALLETNGGNGAGPFAAPVDQKSQSYATYDTGNKYRREQSQTIHCTNWGNIRNIIYRNWVWRVGFFLDLQALMSQC